MSISLQITPDQTAKARVSDSDLAESDLSYAQWVRRAVAQKRDAFVLFDSSVEEPRALLQEKVRAAFGNNVSDRYVSAFVSGNPYVLKALSRRYRVDEDYILTTSAATTAVSLIYNALLTEGDHILVETPRFDLLTTTATKLGVIVDDFQRREPNGGIDLNEIKRQILPQTRLIVLSDLHNPTGALLTPDTLRDLAAFADGLGIRVVIDEVYGDYADAARGVSAVHYGRNIIAVNSLTKIYGLSTLRCGWLIAHPDVLRPIRAYAERFDFTISNLSHALAALVLEDDGTFDTYRRQIMEKTKPIIKKAFAEWTAAGLASGILPSDSCIFFPKITGVTDTVHLSDWLAEHYQVRVAPGEFFNAPGHVRIGFAKDPASMTQAFDRFAMGLRNYRKGR